MKKVLVVSLFIALLLSSVNVFASVGYKKDGTIAGNTTYIDIKKGHSSFDGNTVSLYSSGYKDGVTTNVSLETNLTSAALAYGIIQLQAGSAKSISLAAGTAGQMVTILMTVYDGKTITITDDGLAIAGQNAVVETGWDDIAFNAVYDQVTLLYVDDTYGWIIIGQYGVTVS